MTTLHAELKPCGINEGLGCKWIVRITDGEKTKTVKFGQRGADDYTHHLDYFRRNRYIRRHGGQVSKTNPPTEREYGPLSSPKEKWGQDGIYTKGFWSRWLSWNQPSVKESIRNIEKRFNIDIDWNGEYPIYP